MSINSKVKYYTFLIAKIVIAIIAFYFIYKKILIQPWSTILDLLKDFNNLNLFIFIPILMLSVVNWFSEIYKWKLLSNQFKAISFFTSSHIVLSSFVVSTITPNKIGEYGAKVMFYDKKYWKEILGYNFFGNMMQLFTTLLMVVIFYFALPLAVKNTFPKIYFFSATLLLIVMTIFLFKRKTIITLPWISKNVELKLWQNINNRTKFSVLGLSIIKYLAFSIQFLLLLSLLEKEILISYFPLLTINYIIVSIFPSIIFADLLIRGSVSIYLFSHIGINEITMVTVVLLTWIFNFVIPTLLGTLLMIIPNKQKY